MMHKAIRLIPKEADVKTIWVVDASEQTVRALNRRFPKANVSATEPSGECDVVVVEGQGNASSIHAHLARYGYVLVRRDGSPELLADLYKTLARQPQPRFFPVPNAYLYRPRGSGTIGDQPPAHYQSFYGCKEYIERDAAGLPRFSLVGRNGLWGTRWHYGPFWFEKYYGDVEPTVDAGGPLRFVLWQPLARLDVPKGWKRTRLTNHIKMNGFAELKPGEPYERSWTSHALRHRAKWLKQKDLEIYDADPDAFIEAYKKTKFDTVLKYLFVDLVREKQKTQPKQMRVFGARKPGTNDMVAGFICVDIPEVKQSKHLVSFIHESAKKTSVGTGLMDAWFKHGVERGFEFLDFGVFWAPGDPKDWQGFSRFKSQFGIWFLRYPYPLMRKTGSLALAFKSLFTRP